MKAYCAVVLLLTAASSLFSQKLDQRPLPSTTSSTAGTRVRRSAILNINDIAFWMNADGLNAHDQPAAWGLIYPRGTAGLVWSDGIIWTGKVHDGGEKLIRCGGVHWSAGTQQGVILAKGQAEDRMSPGARIFRVRWDYQTADLKRDASEYFAIPLTDVTLELVDSLRAIYRQDWEEWPWQQGAPFNDLNGDGMMDDNDYPDFLGADQLIWYAYNDLVPFGLAGEPTIGFEVQVTAWAYSGTTNLESVIFKRYKIIYKGKDSTPTDAFIDSLYLTQFADTDVGWYTDDLGGCDSTLSLGFAYNGTTADSMYAPFMRRTPAIGYELLQGPLVPGDAGDEGMFDFRTRSGSRNLPMTSFVLKPTPSAIPDGEDDTFWEWMWKAVRGFWPSIFVPDVPWIDPKGNPTEFPLAGDPVTGKGWVDGKEPISSNGIVNHFLYPGGRRLYLNSGPITMALNDTTEIVVAVIAGTGFDGPHSVQVMKYFATLVKENFISLPDFVASEKAKGGIQKSDQVLPDDYVLRQNFPNPFNPSTTILYEIPIGSQMRLSIVDMLGRELRVLVDSFMEAGLHEAVWDGNDLTGARVPSGVYFCRLEIRGVSLTRKLTVVR